MTNSTQPYTVTVRRENEETGDIDVISEVTYATEALADEAIAWVAAKVTGYLAPKYANEIIRRMKKTPYTPVTPVTSVDDDEMEKLHSF